jgi:hypothetical protein
VLVKLLVQHVIHDYISGQDILYEKGDIVDVLVVTPLMEGLDPVARDSISIEKERVFARWLDPQHTQMLDRPPIPRPLEENQPVPRIPGAGGPPR